MEPITYISTAESWLYLSVVVDLCGGKVAGWSMSTTQDQQLVLRAVLMACWQRPNREPVILHSDRGKRVNVSHLPGGDYIGLEEIAHDIWNVFFGPVHLGWLHVTRGASLDEED